VHAAARDCVSCHGRGVHFFRPVPKEYLHSAELRDIMQFGSSSSAVFFKMRVAGVLHVFQFDTRQVLIQSHVNSFRSDRCSGTMQFLESVGLHRQAP
jgi:hypothetical protein